MRDGSTNQSSHATHVAGTVSAAGVDADAKGMAPNVLVDSYDWLFDQSEMITAAATAPGQPGKLTISNHSYGASAGWRRNASNLWEWIGTGNDQNAYAPTFGQYSAEARNWDSIAYNAPYYLIFQSSGNDNNNNPANGNTVIINGNSASYNSSIHPAGNGFYRNTTTDHNNGYENITGTGISKNVVTVGNVLNAVASGLRHPPNGTLNGSSSRGPTDDGRIKPDLVANGTFVYSAASGSNTAYANRSGTSMSSPSAAGSAALLVQLFRDRYPGGDMRASTLKGLLIHTATDVGNPGPDYHYGWGLIDTKSAADLIIDHHENPGSVRMIEDRLTSADSQRTYTFSWDGTSPIRATLSWTDPAGTATPPTTHDLRTPSLVNDLDLRLTAPDGTTTHYPFVMPFVGDWTVASMSATATTGDNVTDNVEQVLIPNSAQSGTWQATVTYKGALTNDEQMFSLIFSGAEATTPDLDLDSVTPNATPIDTTVTLDVIGIGLVDGSSIRLRKSGRPDIVATSVAMSGLDRIRGQFNLNGVATGKWDVVVTTPDLQTQTLPSAFTIYTELWSENFDQPTAPNLPTGWTTTAQSGSGQWTTVSSHVHTPNNAAYIDNYTSTTTTHLVSPAIPIDAANDDLRLTFHHHYNLEDRWDGGRIEFSVDGGPWFGVDAPNSGLVFEKNGYPHTLNSGSSFGGLAAWTGNSGGFIETVIEFTDTPKFADKSLQIRWTLATDLMGKASGAHVGWHVDTILLTGSLHAKWTGMPITISSATRHQEMEGFGAALSWHLSSVYRNNEARDTAIEKAMFEDLGLDILRLKNWYYPNDSDSSPAMNSNATNHRLFHAAKAANPDIQVLYSSWSPPESLKSNASRRNGGTLTKNASGNYMYQELADYWVEVLDNLGWTPDYLSFQNEPGYQATWETCLFDPNETTNRAGYAQAADAIWDAIKDRPDVPKMVGSEAENMPAFFNLNQPLLSRPYFAVHGYHIYDIGNTSQIDSSTTINRLRKIRNDFGDRPNWQTEFSREFNWIDAARVIHNTLVEANASAYIYWKMFWGANSPDAMIEHVGNTSFQINPPYYTIKHYARHIHKGYERIEVGGSNANVRVSGYLSPAGNRITLVAINSSASSQPVSFLHDNLPVTGIEGYQSVSGNFYQTMAGLDVAGPVLLPASSLTTLVLSLTDEPAIAVFEGESLVPVDDTRVFVASTGVPVAHTYQVKNQGTADLVLSGTPDAVIFAESGTTSHNGFTITSNIPQNSTSLAPGESAGLTITFETSLPGTYTATVSIANNDADKDPYTFTVMASTLTYTITYNGNNNISGTAPSPQTKQHGVPLVLAGNTGNLQKTDFIFAGWNTAANGSGVDYAGGTTYSGNADLTLYAKWVDAEVFLATSQPFNHAAGWADGAYWSDGFPAGAGKEYRVASGRAVHTPNGNVTQTFPGTRLTLGNPSSLGTLRLNRTSTGARTTVVGDLQVIRGQLETTNWNTLHTLQTASGLIPVDTSISIRARSSDTAISGFIIDAALTGTDVTILAEGREALTENNQVRLQRANSISGTIRSTSFGNLIINHTNALQNLTLNRQSGDTGIVTFNQNSMLGGLAGAANLDLGGRVVSIGNNDSDTTYSGQISNGSLTKVGAGALVLSGNSTYAGATLVNGGTLRVDGSLAAGSTVAVNDGASFAGAGTIAAGLTISNGGIFLADGAPLVVGGAVTLSPGAFLDAGGMVPNGNDPVVLMSYGSLSGTFGSADIPFGWGIDYAFGGNSIALVSLSSDSYTITYNGNGNSDGTAPIDSASPYTPGAEVYLMSPSDLAKTGHTFSHWNTAANGSGTPYEPNDIFQIAGNTTLFAQWTPNTYTVNFDANGGDAAVQQDTQVTFGTAYGSLATTERPGFQLLGWFTQAAGGVHITSATTVSIAGNHTLFAQWNAAPVVDAGPDQIAYLSEGEAWTPSSLTPTAWYDASDTDSLTLVSGRVSQWNDKSGNNRHAFQNTADHRPAYRVSDTQLNNRPSIGYDSSAIDVWRYLETPAMAFSNVYFVTYYDAAQFDNWRVVLSDNQSTVNRIRGSQNNTTWSLAGFRMHRSGASSNTTTALPMGPTLWRGEGTRDFGNVPWTILGQKDGWWTTWGSGSIGEMVFTDGSENLATRQQIEGYLAHKWDLPLSEGHPYENEAPGVPSATVTLAGSASDSDGDPLTLQWSKESGPDAPVTFADPSDPQTTATFTVPGTYTLRLTASDGVSSAFDECVVTVGTASNGAVASFGIAGVPAQVVVGSEINHITITALDAENAVATGFTGTVTFGGTAGITGETASFVDGVLSDVSITPTVTGSSLTFTVDGGDGKTGSVSFDVISLFDSWAGGSGLAGGNSAPAADADGDGLTNLQEFAFGTNPLAGRPGPIVFVPGGDVTRPGIPAIMNYPAAEGNPPFRAVFGRRKNHVAAGLTYTVEFSADLLHWDVYQDEPSVLSDGQNDSDVEAVGVPFPASVPTNGNGHQPPQFFRVGVSMD